MRCDKVLSALASRGFFGRWRARRHAARCSRCAAVINEIGMIVEELAAVPPLTTADRQRWLRARDDVAPVSRSWPRLNRPALAAAVAAVLLVSVGIWLNSRSVYLETSPAVVTIVDAKVASASSLREVEEIRARVVALMGELDQLQREADLLDARRDADALELRFAPRTALNDF
jgi:hypothetical protein